MILQLLGGRTATGFLSRYWQKRPLLIRGAVPGFTDIIPARELRKLAANDGVESRLVLRSGRRWLLEHGPFASRRFASLPDVNWTLLVQGLNLHLPAADRLLRRFSFVPYARMDDVMVSYAAPGGGVGPHVDSYDVFLLQGAGRRRWRIARHAAPGGASDANDGDEFVADAPLKLLRRFKAEQEFVLEAGDMLYLPPGWAHDGVALDHCTTYSIGFRAPGRREWLYEFLVRYAEHIAELQQSDAAAESSHGARRAAPRPPARAARARNNARRERYGDPELVPTRHPAAIPEAMLAQASDWLAALRFSPGEVADVLGTWLSEPKPRVVFERPAAPLSLARFSAKVGNIGARLDLATLMLASPAGIHINGETLDTGATPGTLRTRLDELADRRALPPGRYSGALCGLLYDWYLHGWLHAGEAR